MVPELYNSALNAYNAEGQRLADNVDMYMQDYAKEYSDWQGNYDYYMGRVDNARNTYMNNADLHMGESDRVNSAISENNKNAVDNAIWNETNRQQVNAEKAAKESAAAEQNIKDIIANNPNIYKTFDEKTLQENQYLNVVNGGTGSYYDETKTGLATVVDSYLNPNEAISAALEYIDKTYNSSLISPPEKEKLKKDALTMLIDAIPTAVKNTEGNAKAKMAEAIKYVNALGSAFKLSENEIKELREIAQKTAIMEGPFFK
jgi:hypothetical protein